MKLTKDEFFSMLENGEIRYFSYGENSFYSNNSYNSPYNNSSYSNRESGIYVGEDELDTLLDLFNGDMFYQNHWIDFSTIKLVNDNYSFLGGKLRSYIKRNLRDKIKHFNMSIKNVEEIVRKF